MRHLPLGSQSLVNSSNMWAMRAPGTSVIPSLDVDFINGRALLNGSIIPIASLLACTRSGAGSYLNADLTLSSFATNTLRYGTNGLLLESARTNLLLRSQELDNASWTNVDCTITANDTAAPDGTVTAELLVPGVSSSSHKARQNPTCANVAYSHSLYVKPNGYTKVGIREDFVSGHYACFLCTGAGSVIDKTGSATAAITALTNGWYRIEFTHVAVGANPGPGLYILDPTYASGDPAVNWTANGTSGVYFWGAQMEAGAAPSSYIPTTTVAVTRAVDLVTFADLTWFDGAAGSLYAEWTAKNVADATVWAFDAANDVTLNEQTGMSPKILDAGATFAVTVATTAAAAATVKAAARMATNDIALCMNGGTVAVDTSATQPGVLAASRLGLDLSSANSLNGYIRRVAAFKSTLLSNAALQTLTT